MKPVLCLLICLFVGLFVANAQEIPEGADGIELTTTLSDSALFESVQSYLEDEGFEISIADESQGIITTEYKATTNTSQLRILATLENNVAVFKAEEATTGVKNEPLVNDEAGTDTFVFFNTIISRYAKTLDQATVEYLIP